MEIIPHKQVVLDSGLAEKIGTVPGYEFIMKTDSLGFEAKRIPDNDLTIVLWNRWISN